MGQTFEKTFKQEAVRLVQTSGKSQRQVAEDLGVAMSFPGPSRGLRGGMGQSTHSCGIG
jgi:transposase-like protein